MENYTCLHLLNLSSNKILFFYLSRKVKSYLLRLCVAQNALQLIAFVFTFGCNEKSFAITILVFFLSFSFSSPFLEGLAKVFKVISISCFCRHTYMPTYPHWAGVTCIQTNYPQWKYWSISPAPHLNHCVENIEVFS